MVSITDGRLGHLGKQGECIAHQEVLHGGRTVELLVELLVIEPIRVAATLHESPVRHALTAHEQGDADYALVADYGYLGRSAVLKDIEQGYDGGSREIHVGEGVAGLVENFPERKID